MEMPKYIHKQDKTQQNKGTPGILASKPPHNSMKM